jgi:Protein of unknown function DUF262
MAKIPKEEVPTEIEDEYELALDADVDDESLLESPSNASFTITSYGADYTVDTLIARLKTEAFYVPTFQRRFVWSQRHASRFIESLLMGLPVPGIFLYKEPRTNRHLVVDGQQRLRTLQYFYSGLFLERKFRLTGVRAEWDGKTYADLEPSEQLKLDDSIVHATIFQQDEPKDQQRSLYFVFERINSGGIRLSSQEIRNCINDGPLLQLVRVLNEDANWRDIFGERRNTRLKDQELILRFLAMMRRADKYSRPMRDFLNDFTAECSDPGPQLLEEMKNLFTAAIRVCALAKGKAAFRPSRALNAAVFEAVMVGIATRISVQKRFPDIPSVGKAYDKLLSDSKFIRACERATADEESVKTRQSLSIEAFKSA